MVCTVRQWRGTIWWALTATPEAWDSWVGQSHRTQPREGINFSHWGKQHIPRVKGDTWKNNPPSSLLKTYGEDAQFFSLILFHSAKTHPGREVRVVRPQGERSGVKASETEALLKQSTVIKTWEVKEQVLPKFPCEGEQTNCINRMGH